MLVNETVVSDEPKDDLRGDLAAQFEAAEKAPAEVEAAPEVSAEPAETEQQIAERERDEKGRFAAKTEAETKSPAAPEKAAAEPIPSKDNPAKASASVAIPRDAPPAGWTADGKSAWSVLAKELPTLPPAVQTAVQAMQMAAHKRDEDAANGSRQWSEEKRRYEGALAPVAQAAQRRGLSVDQGLQSLMRAQDYLDRDPVNAIRWLAQNYGVNLSSLTGQQPAQDQPQEPNIQELVRQAVQPLLNPIQERFAAEEHQRQSSVTNLVTDFAASPGHEHFDAVQNELMAMIPSIKAANPFWTHQQVLQDAYDRAVYANPTTRLTILMAERQKDDDTRRTEASQRAVKARTAASSVTGFPSGTAAPAQQGSLREELEAAFATVR